jgi:hypothetical protein
MPYLPSCVLVLLLCGTCCGFEDAMEKYSLTEWNAGNIKFPPLPRIKHLPGAWYKDPASYERAGSYDCWVWYQPNTARASWKRGEPMSPILVGQITVTKAASFTATTTSSQTLSVGSSSETSIGVADIAGLSLTAKTVLQYSMETSTSYSEAYSHTVSVTNTVVPWDIRCDYVQVQSYFAVLKIHVFSRRSCHSKEKDYTDKDAWTDIEVPIASMSRPEFRGKMC